MNSGNWVSDTFLGVALASVLPIQWRFPEHPFQAVATQWMCGTGDLLVPLKEAGAFGLGIDVLQQPEFRGDRFLLSSDVTKPWDVNWNGSPCELSVLSIPALPDPTLIRNVAVSSNKWMVLCTQTPLKFGHQGQMFTSDALTYHHPRVAGYGYEYADQIVLEIRKSWAYHKLPREFLGFLTVWCRSSQF